MKHQNLDGFVFSRRTSFSWLTAGAESGVDEFSEIGVADVVITADKACLVSPNNEIDLLMTEAVAGQSYEPVVYTWYDDRFKVLRQLLGKKKTGSDRPMPGCRELYNEVKELRFSLTGEEQDRLKELGSITASITGRVCREIRPGDSEFQIAGRLKGLLGQEGIYVPVALIAADERLDKYRHPIPTSKQVKNKVMVVICARRHGLTVALTRIVYFGSVPPESRKRLDLVNEINAGLIAATVPGEPVSKIYREAVGRYSEAGYEGEWEKHHQGGPIGYENRDYLATDSCPALVFNNQAFAWNPMIVNVKSEETIIASSSGFTIITGDPEWPYKNYWIGDNKIALPDFWTI